MTDNDIPVWGDTDVPEMMSEREIAKAMGGGEIINRTPPLFENHEVINLTNWDQLAGLFEQKGIVPELADETLGDGFALLDDKNRLIGMPCAFIDWTFHTGQMGEFVSVRCVVRVADNGELKRFRFSDGSTGVYEQLRSYTEAKGHAGGLVAKRGLRRSDYQVENPLKPGVMMPASTYYIDTSAVA